MDAYLAIVSLRVVREYSSRPISAESLDRILHAGRATGSSQNRQLWRFFVLTDRTRLERLAKTVYAPSNVAGSQLAIAIANGGKGSFDIGRVAQDMMLAAWNEGIGSAPNGTQDAEAARELLGIAPEESLGVILTFGYPLHPWRPREDDVKGIVDRIKRKPLDEIVVYVDRDS